MLSNVHYSKSIQSYYRADFHYLCVCTVILYYSLNVVDVSAVTMVKEPLSFEEGWGNMQKGITKLKRILETKEDNFDSEQYMMLYTYPLSLIQLLTLLL